MSKKRIESYIPKALKAIEELTISNNGEVAKQFNGYIASFGASVRQAGLLATVLFYGNANSNSEEDRTKVIQAIEKIIGHEIIEHNNIIAKDTREEVEDAAAALKLSIRTFKLV